MHVGVDVKCMHTNFGGRSVFSFRDMETAKFPFRGMDYSPWVSKNLIGRNWLKKFKQVRIDELCMCTNFDGHVLCCFGNKISFQIWPNLISHGLYIVYGLCSNS